MKTVTAIPQPYVVRLLARIREKRLTGQLVMNFSQGTPAGGAEWRESPKSGKSPIDFQAIDLTKTS